MTDASQPQISIQMTPNPNAIQFQVDRVLIESGTCHFTSAESAREGSPLAAKLFEVDGVESILIGHSFVTVTKKGEVEWPLIAQKVGDALKAGLTSGEPVVNEGAEIQAEKPLDETGRKIKQIIDEEIRPAVARDGGDVIFDSYEDGIVRLHLQGACTTCPSSVMTLKFGIENRLKQAVPEIKEVVGL